MLLGNPLLSIFGLSAESIEIGASFFQTISFFYIVYGLSMSIKGYLEGKSDMVFSGIIGICSPVVRIICSYTLADIWGNMVVAYAEAFGWVFLLIAFAIRYIQKYNITKNQGGNKEVMLSSILLGLTVIRH